VLPVINQLFSSSDRVPKKNSIATGKIDKSISVVYLSIPLLWRFPVFPVKFSEVSYKISYIPSRAGRLGCHVEMRR
jgi:hypothetical protein